MEPASSETNYAKGLAVVLIGGFFNLLIWIILGNFGIPGSISGWILAVIDIYAFESFAGKIDKKAAIMIAVSGVIWLLASDYIFWGWEIAVAGNAAAGEKLYNIFDGLKALPAYFQNPEFTITCFIRDVIISLGFFAIGLVAGLVPRFRKEKERKNDENAKFDKKYNKLKEEHEEKRRKK